MSDPWYKLPARIMVIGRRYKTEVVDKVDGDDSDGESDPVQQRVLLRRNHGFEGARDTALHEIIHAVDSQMALDLSEAQVEGLGTGMLAMLRDNPAFVRWLMAKDHG